MANLETYGDLKKLINSISKQQKGEKIISKGKEFFLDQVLGAIPGASNAKTTFDLLKTAVLKPDTKKTGTWLDKLDLDDQMLAIIDDTVENGFMQAITKSIESEPDNKPLEDNFDMNEKMQSYLKQTYKNRTVTGIRENKMKKQPKQAVSIKEEVIPTQVKQAAGVTAISKDLNDQTSNFRTINSKEKLGQLLDTLVGKLDPKFTQSSLFKVAVRDFYNKYK